MNVWLDVRDPRTGKLLFRFDPGRDLIHLKRGPIDVTIPLRRYRSSGSATESHVRCRPRALAVRTPMNTNEEQE